MLKKLISKSSCAGAFRSAGRSALPLVIVVAWFWLFSWPHFEGDYVGHGGHTAVRVTSSGDRLQVRVTRRTEDAERVSTFPATTDYTTLLFGEGIERGAVIFHPFSVQNYELVTGSDRAQLNKTNWLSRYVSSHPLLALAVLAVAMAAGMLIMIANKAKTDPRLIHPMWLAFFTALFFSTAILIVSGKAHIFNYEGVPQNDIARAIVACADFFVDVIPECQALLGALALIVLPQWCAYVMAGLNGTARRSRFVWIAWKWVAMLLAKSFMSASAIGLSIALVGAYFGWVSPEPKSVAVSVLAALMLLGFGIFLFCLVPNQPASQGVPRRTVRRVHRYMRRRLRRGKGEIAAQLQRELHQPAVAVRLPWCIRVTRFLSGV